MEVAALENQPDDKREQNIDFVNKEKIKIVIQTQTHRVIGMYYKREEIRLMDSLKNDEHIIPITDAKVYSNTVSTERYKTKFIAIYRDHIIWAVSASDFIVEN